MKRLLQTTQRCALALSFLLAGSSAAYADIPSIPGNLEIDVVVPDNPAEPMTASLVWEASDDADGYRVYAKPLGENWQGGQFELLGETTTTTYDITTAVDIVSGAYAFFVAAYNGDGDSPASNVVSSACGREWNDGDLSEYNGTGLTAIVSTPGKTTHERMVYRYDVNSLAEYTATPVGAVEYSVEGPAGMDIDRATGVILWTPSAAGTYGVTVTAKELTGAKFDQQMWQIEVQPEGVTSVGEDNTLPSVSLYPNPTTSRVTTTFAARAGQAQLAIADAHGTQVLTRSVSTTEGLNTVSLDIQNIASGRYFLSIISGGKTAVLPLTIAR